MTLSRLGFVKYPLLTSGNLANISHQLGFGSNVIDAQIVLHVSYDFFLYFKFLNRDNMEYT